MPQTTTATAISAVAIGPVNAVFRFCAEEVQGSPCAKAPPADTLIAADSLKRRFFCDFMLLLHAEAPVHARPAGCGNLCFAPAAPQGCDTSPLFRRTLV